MADPTRPGWLVVAPFIFVGLWSGGYVAAKLGLQDIQPLTLLAVRYALVVLLMIAMMLILRPRLPRTRAEWLHLTVVGLLIQALYFGCSYLAFGEGVAAATVALVMSLQPILVAMLAPALAGERVGPRRWTGLALGLLGTVTVITARAQIETPSLAGLGFAVMALASMIAATLYEKRFGVSGASGPREPDRVPGRAGRGAAAGLAAGGSDDPLDTPTGRGSWPISSLAIRWSGRRSCWR